jgi:hypothetical protein
LERARPGPKKEERRTQGRSKQPDQGHSRTDLGRRSLSGALVKAPLLEFQEPPNGSGWSFAWKQYFDAHASFQVVIEVIARPRDSLVSLSL